MCKLISLICFCFTFTYSIAQSAGQLIKSINDSLNGVKNISYNIEVAETKDGRETARHYGTVTAFKHDDSLYGFTFDIIFDSVENIFDGRFGFIINDNSKIVKQVNASLLKKEREQEWLIGELLKGFMPSEDFQTVPSGDTRLWKISQNNSSKYILIDKQQLLPVSLEQVKYNGPGEKTELIHISAIHYNHADVDTIKKRLNALVDTHTLLPLEDIGLPVSFDARDSMVGKAAPDFMLSDFNGKAVSLSQLKGKVVLLNFWEPWCGPCRMSLSHLQDLSNQLANPNLVILSLTKDNVSASRKILADRKITLTNLITNKSVNSQYKVEAIPQYYLINQEGMIVYCSKEGYEKKMEDALLQLLK